MPGFAADYNNVFDDRVAITATRISTNVIDLKHNTDNTLRSIVGGREFFVEFLVTEAFTSGGATTIEFAVKSDSTDNLATSATSHASVSFAKAALTLGKYFYLSIPETADFERYLGCTYTITGSDATAGKIVARATHAVAPTYVAYADRVSLV
jgi:hypothetical protein